MIRVLVVVVLMILPGVLFIESERQFLDSAENIVPYVTDMTNFNNIYTIGA